MANYTCSFRNLPGTEAATGWAGSHTLVADRQAGVAGGQGLGFNGGQLLALALGGCFCNDLRFVSHRLGVTLDEIAVDVTIDISGAPLLARSAQLDVRITAGENVDLRPIFEEAKETSTISNSVTRGLPVNVTLSDEA